MRKGVSQRALAHSAGTTQAAISRIESGRESPSFERFTSLLRVLGERPLLATQPLEPEIDGAAAERAAGRRHNPEQRVAEAAAWSRLSTQLASVAARRRCSP